MEHLFAITTNQCVRIVYNKNNKIIPMCMNFERVSVRVSIFIELFFLEKIDKNSLIFWKIYDKLNKFDKNERKKNYHFGLLSEFGNYYKTAYWQLWHIFWETAYWRFGHIFEILKTEMTNLLIHNWDRYFD
jgi:hypothetical protein